MHDKPSDSFALQVSREIGQMNGQLSSLISTVEMMSATINGLDSRLRANERESTKTATMIGSIGILAGGIGTFLMNVILKK